MGRSLTGDPFFILTLQGHVLKKKKMGRKVATTDLEKRLATEVEELRDHFEEAVTEALNKEYTRCEKYKGWTEEQWYEAYGLTPEYRYAGGPLRSLRDKEGNDVYKAFLLNRYSPLTNLRKEMEEVRAMLHKGRENFVAGRLDEALYGFDLKVIKTAAALEKYGVTAENFTVRAKDVNPTGIELYLDVPGEDYYVHCYTIIADGPIKVTHYRFIVKKIKKK
jgi:hypothetical protein